MPEDDAPVTKGDLKEIMAKVLEQANNNTKRLLDDKLPEPKSNKRQKLEKIKLNSKANQQQMDFQQQVIEIFERTENRLQKQKLDEAIDLIDQGKKLCFGRIKLIRLADRDGWSVANAYQSDDLASDTDDDKRIIRATRSAARKRKQRESFSATEC